MQAAAHLEQQPLRRVEADQRREAAAPEREPLERDLAGFLPGRGVPMGGASISIGSFGLANSR